MELCAWSKSESVALSMLATICRRMSISSVSSIGAPRLMYLSNT
jgi:hypothetical protein